MGEKFIEPKFNANAFTCPHCQVVAQMKFFFPSAIKWRISDNLNKIQQEWSRTYLSANIQYRFRELQDLGNCYEKYAPTFAICTACQKINVWIKNLDDEKMVYPKPRLTPPPNEDLPDDIKKDYEEASLILQDSPRAACALLRLALQKIMIHLGEGKNLNKAIESLIDKDKINENLQKALDCIRVVGNNAVHPNEINIENNGKIARALFYIINFIAEKILTDKKRIDRIYSLLPEAAKRENKNK